MMDQETEKTVSTILQQALAGSQTPTVPLSGYGLFPPPNPDFALPVVALPAPITGIAPPGGN